MSQEGRLQYRYQYQSLNHRYYVTRGALRHHTQYVTRGADTVSIPVDTSQEVWYQSRFQYHQSLNRYVTRGALQHTQYVTRGAVTVSIPVPVPESILRHKRCVTTSYTIRHKRCRYSIDTSRYVTRGAIPVPIPVPPVPESIRHKRCGYSIDNTIQYHGTVH
jgi:hypothetical protein